MPTSLNFKSSSCDLMKSYNAMPTVNAIKSLKIQGASQVRAQFGSAIQKWVHEDTTENINKFQKKFHKIIRAFIHARPTEPALQFTARKFLKIAREHENLHELKQALVQACKAFEQENKNALKTIAKNGAKLIKRNSVIFTHCHSHSVEAVLVKAREKIKYVIATETRPAYQGRITVKNLTRAGIKCTLIADSAVSSFMAQADYLFTGADAVQANGDVINKIGTRTVSEIARKFHVSHYAVTGTDKFDLNSLQGKQTEIEQRNPKEVWNVHMKRLRIENPAFDVTPAENIKGIITEKGIIKPGKVRNIMKKMQREYL